MLLYHLDVGLGSGAFLSLSMFFTLSGYLIASQLFAQYESRGRIDLPRFWERRIRRLLPASTLALLLALLYSYVLEREDMVFAHAGDVLAAVLYVPNWRFVWTGQSYGAIFSDPSPVQHFWSLGVEEQFYFIFPLLVVGLLAHGSRRRFVLVIAVLAALSSLALLLAHEAGAPLGHAYYGTDTRAAEILIGVLLASVLSWRAGSRPASASGQRGLQLAGLFALGTTLVLWNATSERDLWFYRGGAAAYSVLTAVLVSAALRPGPVRTLLSFPPLPYVGRISYGLYVYHWPIYLIVDRLDPTNSTPTIVGFKLAATLLVAAASSYLLESPIRQRRLLVGPRRWIAPIVAMSVVSLAAASLMISHANVESLISEDLEDPLELSDRQNVSNDLPTIVVIGNSVAKNIAYGLRKWGHQRDVFVVDRAMNGCGLASGGELEWDRAASSEKKRQKCREWKSSWPSTINKLDPDLVVLLTGALDLATLRVPGQHEFSELGDPHHDEWLVSELVLVAETLAASGAEIVWLTSPCTVERPWASRRTGVGAFDPARIKHFNEVIIPRVVASSPWPSSSIDLFEIVCPDGRFTTRVGDVEKGRGDGVHFAPEGSRWLGERIGPALLDRIASSPPKAGPNAVEDRGNGQQRRPTIRDAPQ